MKAILLLIWACATFYVATSVFGLALQLAVQLTVLSGLILGLVIWIRFGDEESED